MRALLKLPPVRRNSTLLTFTLSEALASSVVVPERVSPSEGTRTDVVGATFSKPNAYRSPTCRLESDEPTYTTPLATAGDEYICAPTATGAVHSGWQVLGLPAQPVLPAASNTYSLLWPLGPLSAVPPI